MAADGSNALVDLYRDRFGDPLTTDEVYGYWLFLAGTVLAVVGMALFLTSMGRGRTGTRELAYLFAGSGLAGAFAGLVVGQSYHRTARRLVYLGLAVSLTAMAWFLSVFPGGWSLSSGSAQGVVALYTLGVAVVTLAGVLAPLSVGYSRERRELEGRLAATERESTRRAGELEADLEEARAELREREERVASLESDLEEASADATTVRRESESVRDEFKAAVAHVADLERSDATFDVYRDKAGKWRWRLVHRNGNIVATSGEGYSSDRSARRGMRSVKRNALGAAVVWQRDEPEPEPLTDPVAEEPQATFEVYEDADGEARWRLRHDNGQVIAAATRGFSDARAARESAESLRGAIGPADYLEFDPAGIEVYEDASGEFRWRLVHRNGAILGDSGEGYATRSNARRAADRFQELAAEATVGGSEGVRFETYADEGGEHRWRLVAANGEAVADSGEGYGAIRERDEAVERVREYAPEADRLTVATAAVEVYEDGGGEYRWRLRHRNGTVLGTAGEGYTTRAEAVNAVNRVKRHAPNAPLADGDSGGDEGADESEADTGGD